MNNASVVIDHRTELLAFLKSRFPLFDQSNVFFRDIQYGIQIFLQRRGIRAGYPESERIAKEFVSALEREGVLVAMDRQTWKLNYPQFRTPVSRPAPAARPAPPAPARPAPAKPAPEQEAV